MREILFRAKRESDNKWVYGVSCEDYIMKQIRWGREEDGCENPELFMYNIIPETLGQYVGLPDKNNMRIFEGDIVETKYGRLCEVIRFISPSFNGWDLKPLEDRHKRPDEHDLWKSENLLVVGNVHDNTGLLRGEL